MKGESNKIPEVNLIPGDELENRPGGRFLKWALTWGKRIIVITELIVILAFLSRFWLDTEVANNSEKIDQKKAIVQSQFDFEAKFRRLTDRISKAKTIEALASPLTTYDQVVSLIPVSVRVGQFALTNASVSLSANSDEDSLGQTIEAFKSSPNFVDVNIERVAQASNKPTVDFSLSANYLTIEKTND